jgi:hypothetical protein
MSDIWASKSLVPNVQDYNALSEGGKKITTGMGWLAQSCGMERDGLGQIQNFKLVNEIYMQFTVLSNVRTDVTL